MEKDLSYRLSADPRQFEKGFKSAEASARALEKELARLEAEQARVDAAMQEAGTVALAAGAAITAGLVMATQAAISWESAWTGVAKVVSGTPEQMEDLEESLRGLARTLPQTHEEIAAVAAAAGQLGVKRQDIVQFTRVMVDLGTATNLTSEEAAFALSRLMNIMQTAPDDVGRLGASIVELGNNSATTEQDIVDMALRIAGAGKTVRMSEADVIGFAGALSSVGIMAEAGGSAISRAFIAIEGAVRAGGEDLETFAAVSGMTAADFTKAWQVDSARATAAFIQGLGRMQASGQDVFATLKDLGLSEILLRDALLRLAGAGDLVSRSLDIANRGWSDNTALLAEAERRYQTVESRIQIAKNNLNDFAIDMGNVFLPAVGKAADLVSALGEILGELPGPVKVILGLLAAATAALLLTGGAALIAVPQIAAYRASIDTLAASQGRLAAATVAASGMLGRVGTFLAGPWGIAIGVAVAALTAFTAAQANARSRARELADTLDTQSGAVTKDTAVWVANQLASKGAVDAAERLGISTATLTKAIMGEQGALDEVNAAIDGVEVKGNQFVGVQDKKVAAAARLRTVLAEMGGDLANATELQRQLTEATGATTRSTSELEPNARTLAQTLGVTADEADDLTAGIDQLDKELQALFDRMFSVEEAEDAAVRAMRRMTEEANANGGALKGNSEAALANRDNVRAVINAHLRQVQAMAESGATAGELTEKTERLRKKFVDQARAAGMSEDQIKEYAKAYDQVPGLVNTSIKTPGLSTASGAVSRFKELWESIKDRSVRLRAVMASQPNPASGMSTGGMVDGPTGFDNVPFLSPSGTTMLTKGEYVSTVASTSANRAALEAANNGARLAVVGRPGTSGGGAGGGVNVEQLVVQAWTDRFSWPQVSSELQMHAAI
ncbi:phage tail tape measure protein [Micromonospora carbonacea]|uniref:Phage tail tape measure protein n=1 Tax=Micromonospora carbonacea TaxID=47853 RepID=A0A7H8XI78_9ACTN|nr:phage tail tape measure protein [Micromonospora carbonacea]MBB5828147.1 TP901 family phage tail tape measure protein [Micromonospora carbonacea]QLD24208.1 phage tail tape measure protein [Micromonospora carbonacea]